MESKIQAALERIRPALQYDGGDLELVKIDTKRKEVHIRFSGACTHCSISEITLKHVIERELLKVSPKIRTVLTRSE